MVWQAATRENQRMKDTFLDSKLTGRLDSHPPDEAMTSSRHQPHSTSPLLFASHQTPGLQREALLKSDSSLDEKQKNGLDFYC